MQEQTGDKQVVRCNYSTATSACSHGSAAYVSIVVGGSFPDGRIKILARSRSGRLIHKWESLGRLRDFRIATLPPEHPLRRDDRIAPADIIEHYLPALNRESGA